MQTKKKPDIAWDHCSRADPKNRLKVKCNYCDKVMFGGINRMKHHLAGTKTQVTACPEVDVNIKNLFKDLLMDFEEKKSRAEAECFEHERDGENEKLASNLDFVVQKRTPKTMHQPLKNREPVVRALCRLLYGEALPFNVVKSPLWKEASLLVRKYGKGLKLPSNHEARVTYLNKEWKRKKAMEIKKKLLQKKASNPKKKVKAVSFDLPRNEIVSYDPKSAALAQPADSQAKSAAIERANKVQVSLPSELPSFVKPMLPSHVTGGVLLEFPEKFCDANLPKHDETIVLVDEDDQEFSTTYLVDKTGLSGGWRGFSTAHNLIEGDTLVFQLIEHLKFKVYIVRVYDRKVIDGVLGLLNLVPCGTNVYQRQIEKGSRNLQRAEDMEIDSQQDTVQEKGLVLFDQTENSSEYADSVIPEKLRVSRSVIEFKNIKVIDDFSIVVDGLVIDSEIPKHLQIKYYNLCRSQKTYLHDNLIKGLNVKLVVGIILETVTIADAIRACKVTITREDIETWDKTLKAFEEVGMKVGFLRARISKLIGLLFESNELLEAKRNERVKADDEMRDINKKLCGVWEVIKNLDGEIETLELKGQNLEPAFHKEANAAW